MRDRMPLFLPTYLYRKDLVRKLLSHQTNETSISIFDNANNNELKFSISSHEQPTAGRE